MDTSNQTQDKLQSLAFLGAQFAETAHELRNLWMVLDTSILILRKKLQHYPEAHSATNAQFVRLEQQLAIGQHLMEDILEIARDRSIQQTKVSLSEWVSETLSWIKYPQGITLSVNVEKYEIMLDTRKMRQVLINLIHNAIDALNSSCIEDKKIHVQAQIRQKESQDYLYLSISNNGPSIDSSMISRLFEPFFSTKTQGTGLGLALCKRIVEAHHGSISVTSTEDSETCFEIQIPLSLV